MREVPAARSSAGAPADGTATGVPRLPVRPVAPTTRAWLVVFAALTLLATSQLLVLPEHTSRSFAWTIEPPVTAAFLGAGYAAGFVLVVLTLRASSWAEARVTVVTVLVFTVVTLVATLLHLDRFHLSDTAPLPRAAAWFWLAVYVVVPVGLVVTVTRQQRMPGRDPVRERPLPRLLATVGTAQGAVMLALGAALLVHPPVAAALWPWPLTPLTARTTAAWLLAFALATGLALREGDLARLRIPTVGYTVFGVLQLSVLVRFHEQVAWGTVPATGYVVLMAGVAAVGAVGWYLARGLGRTRRSTG